MKRKLVILTGIVIVLAVFYQIVNIFNVDMIRNDRLFYVAPESYQDMITKGDLVIEGEKTGGSESFVEYEDEFYDGYTLTTITVTKVIQNNTEHVVQAGDELVISEPYFWYEYPILPGKQYVIKGNYTELQPNYKYFLVLGWNEQMKQFGISGLENGKFNLDDQDEEEATITRENEQHQKLRKEVREEYEKSVSKK